MMYLVLFVLTINFCHAAYKIGRRGISIPLKYEESRVNRKRRLFILSFSPIVWIPLLYFLCSEITNNAELVFTFLIIFYLLTLFTFYKRGVVKRKMALTRGDE